MKLKKLIATVLMAVVAFSVFAEDFSKYTHVKPRVTTSRTGKKALSGNADDPAIWVHPTNPARSLIFGVDKSEGIWVWTLDGKELTYFDPWGKPGNIDVNYGLNLGGGKRVDIVAVNLRKVTYKSRISKVAVYAINPNWTSGADVLTTLADGRSDGNDITPSTYGFTTWKDKAKDRMYIFEAPDKAPYNPVQWELVPNAAGTAVTARKARVLEYAGSVNEGMVADEDTGFYYTAEEVEAGVHKYIASEDASPKSVSFFATDADGYRGDREGIALYKVSPSEGYLIVCDQAAKAEGTFSVFRIYDIKTEKLVKTVVPLNELGDYLWDDDGVEATSRALPGFPHGVVIAHDGDHATHPVYDWADFAGDDLRKAGK